MNRKERRAARKKAGRSPSAPGASAALFARALQAHQAGNLPEAESLYRHVLAIEPNHAEAMQFLGLIAHHRGQPDVAIDLIKRAIALNDQAPHFYINFGEILRSVGRLDEAEASQRRALALMPHAAEAHNNLGNTLEDQGRFDEAVASYACALALWPNEGGMLYNFANALVSSADGPKALTIARQALRNAEAADRDTRRGDRIAEPRADDSDAQLCSMVARALSEACVRPQELAMAAALLVKGSLGSVDTIGLPEAAHSALLQVMLENVAIADLELERHLTRLRSMLLDRAESQALTDPIDPVLLRLCCALARQCFITEYVYDRSADELARAQALRERLTQTLAEGRTPSSLHAAVVAAYFPLHRVAQAERLLDFSWPDGIAALLTQQLREPAQERALADAMPSLTPIAKPVSMRVQQQYEENPYPRWVKATAASAPTTVDAFLAKRFSHAPLRALGKGGAIDMLIAGCGTGQHSIETAQLFVGARVLAIDLSRASLAYAKRQTEALGLPGIDYAQADILELGSLGRSFDVIEASGVLHHLGDPMAGWRVLVSLLRPGGLMWVGLYSALARQDIVAARDFIAERGFDASEDAIRAARQAVIAAGEAAPFASVTRTADFFSTSGCRDLLFNVEEHRLTLPEIGEFLTANKLRFIGFEVDRRVEARYRARFPADKSLTDLACWHQFEAENPATFRTMYQFWVQKDG